jgi:putative two-component system response regulator
MAMTAQPQHTELSPRALLDQARTYESSRPNTARQMVQQARVLGRAAADRAAESEALYRLASISYAQGNGDDAFSLVLEARELARACGATVVEVWALNLIGIVHYNAGNYSEALTSALQALELYRTTDHRVDEGNLLNTVAVIHHSLRDTDRAIVMYEAAIDANRKLDRPENDAITLTNMAKARAERNENLLAISLGEEGLALAQAHSPGFVPDILARLATAYAALDSGDRATECLDQADSILAERSANRQEVSPASVLAVREARGKVLAMIGRPHAAVAELEAALDIAGADNSPETVLDLHTELARVHKSIGDFESALRHQEARFKLHQELFDRGTDLRIKTLQMAHDTENKRQHAEIVRLRTSEVDTLARARTHDLESSQFESFRRLAIVAEARNSMAGEHPVRVGELSAEIAEELGQDPEWVDTLRIAAQLHDVGKVVVPDAILLKPAPLTPAEFEIVKTHTTVGAELLSGSASPLLQLAAEVALRHHERWDGSGYPGGLAGEDIPLSGRVVTVADVFDALTSERVYKHAWTTLDALRYILGAAGSQFEPRVVEAFVRVMQRRDPSLADVRAI